MIYGRRDRKLTDVLISKEYFYTEPNTGTHNIFMSVLHSADFLYSIQNKKQFKMRKCYCQYTQELTPGLESMLARLKQFASRICHTTKLLFSIYEDYNINPIPMQNTFCIISVQLANTGNPSKDTIKKEKTVKYMRLNPVSVCMCVFLLQSDSR